MSWSYGEEVVAHEAAYAAAMRKKEDRHDRHDPKVPRPTCASELLPCM